MDDRCSFDDFSLQEAALMQKIFLFSYLDLSKDITTEKEGTTVLNLQE
jgi:hypothetical protein